MPDEQGRTTPPDPSPKPKQGYRKPALVTYGPISKLTRSGGSTRNEQASPRRQAKSCL